MTTITYLNENDARLIADNSYDQYVALIETGQYNASDIQYVIDTIDNIYTQTNIESYIYSLAILNKIKLLATQELEKNESTLIPEDIHYMNESDFLPVMAASYYGDVNYLPEILRKNNIYNTDEAIRLGILRVISRDEV